MPKSQAKAMKKKGAAAKSKKVGEAEAVEQDVSADEEAAQEQKPSVPGKKNKVKKGKRKAEVTPDDSEQQAAKEDTKKRKQTEEESESDDEDKPMRKTKARRLEEGEEEVAQQGPRYRGVIYIGNLPKDFEEAQIKAFFCQFGEVTRHKLWRSRKTGRSKRFGFVEFREQEVAKIVAETMNKYLIDGQQLRATYMPYEQVGRGAFEGRRNGFWARLRFEDMYKVRQQHHGRPKVELDGDEVPMRTEMQVDRANYKRHKLEKKLGALGIDFDLEAVCGPKQGPHVGRALEASSKQASGSDA